MARARNVQLSTQNAGMTRLRRKGRASPATMYDCLNAYITLSGTIKPRPGTRTHKVLPAGTAGLVAHKGKLCVFTSRDDIVDDDDRYAYIVVKHPARPSLAVTQVHFAQPFMGFLYAVVEFEDNQYFHYWVQELSTWEARKGYTPGQYVQPSTPNGFMYKAVRDTLQNPLWAAAVERQVGERIEPTVPNGFYYECIATSGGNPRSGDVEPPWPTVAGETIIESQSITYQPSTPITSTPSDPGDRYGNPSFRDPGVGGVVDEIER